MASARDWLWLLAALLAIASIFTLAFGLLQWRGLIWLARPARRNRRLATAVLLVGGGLLGGVGTAVALLLQTAYAPWLGTAVLLGAAGVGLLLQTVRAGRSDHE